jgi:hypothetical protein
MSHQEQVVIIDARITPSGYGEAEGEQEVTEGQED